MDIKYKYISGIYVIKNNIDDRIYIGSSVNLYNRYHLHLHELSKEIHSNIKMQRFVNKYGVNELYFEILEICKKEDIIEREQYYIDELKPKFNICPMASNSLGYRHTDETLKKLSKIRKGKQTIGMLGKHHTEETKSKISEKAKIRGIPVNCLKASKIANTGKIHTKKHRAIISEKQKKITPKQEIEIRKLLLKGVYQKDIAPIYNVSQRVICRIKRNEY